MVGDEQTGATKRMGTAILAKRSFTLQGMAVIGAAVKKRREKNDSGFCCAGSCFFIIVLLNII